MAKLSNGSEKREVKKGESLLDAGEELGVPFSCTEGNCGTCLTTIVSGSNYLDDLTEAEDDFGLEENERLLCQAKFTSDDGEVVIET